MTKLLVTADIHGHYSAWKKLTAKLGPGDALAIAGDLFDTRYGSHTNNDYHPEQIKKEFSEMPHMLYYVYGNCDQERFFRGFEFCLKFRFNGHRILIQHGHIKHPDTSDVDIIIEGHSHVKRLEKTDDTIHLNPGSPVSPRDRASSYAEISSTSICLRDMAGNIISQMKTGSKADTCAEYDKIFLGTKEP